MSLDEAVKKFESTISKLEKRIVQLENAVFEKSEPLPAIHDDQMEQEFPPEEKINFEGFSGSSPLGWLGIIISIICCFFFVHYSFRQNWITGIGQPLVLAVMGLVLFVIADIIRRKDYLKFGLFLALLSSTLLFLCLYWASIKTGAINHPLLITATLFLWAIHLLWSSLRKTSLWACLGVAGTCLIPIFVIDDYTGTHTLSLYYWAIIALTFAYSFVKNWSWPSLVSTLSCHIFLLSFIRIVSAHPAAQTNSLLWLTTSLPAIFILWSGSVALLHNRPTSLSEKLTWAINNIFSYIYILVFWGTFNKPWLLLIPLAANAILYFISWIKNNRQTHEFLYLLGAVVATAIALTLLMPIPFDIMTLCLFAVFLGHFGNKEEGWHLKSVSGGMIIWSLIFLFSMRFHFIVLQETAFLNLRFSSFVIAFLCFGYQGKMINNDPNAKEMGPILGQGLLSLGLSVLLLGLSGEIMHVFPAGDAESISQLALLFLTILGGAFSFAVAYAGVTLNLFFIRILSTVFFLLLVFKLLVFDLFRLDLPYLVISLACVALLLGGTSVLLKKKISPDFVNMKQN